MQLRSLLKAKIHHARVTEACVDYIGSIAMDESLMAMVDVLPGERVCLWNVTNGERLETYALPAPAGSGSIIVNGAAARRCSVGDKIIVACFLLTDEIIRPKLIRVDENNRFVEWLHDNTRS